MTSRGRYSQANEWDSRDDYSSSVYDQQYQDDDCGSDDNLDHCRLYIRNIPKALNEEGLRSAFAKFGTLVEVYLSKDPQKHYALVKYETPGEAKLAMMKMNRTEPLKLQIVIAHKSKANQSNRTNRDWQDRNTNVGRDRSDRSLSTSNREETASVVSRGRTSRVQDEIPNGDNNMEDLMMEDDYVFSDMLDSNLHLELENLKLEQLKVREEQLQCKQRVILLKQAERKPISQMSNRCIMPDGKIVVRNIERLKHMKERNVVRFSRDSRDADVSFSAGAGDSLKLPGLQRVAVRQCVVCGGASDAYCAGCGITPYCSENCQRRDWQLRHRAVCHNLARMQNENARAAAATAAVTADNTDNESRAQPAMPLRRPYGNTPNKREFVNRQDSTEGRNSTGAFTSKASVKSNGSNADENQFKNSQEKQRKPFQRRNFNQEKNYEPVKAATPVSPKVMEEPFNRQRNQPQAAAKKPEAAKEQKVEAAPSAPVTPVRQRTLVPKTSVPDPSTEKPEVLKPQEAAPSPKETETVVVVTPAVPPAVTPANPPAVVPANPPAVPPASVSDVTPTRKIVPKNYLLERMSIGDSIIMSVDAKASDCRVTRGDFVCLTMAEAFELDYHSLCEDFVIDCNKDDQPIKLTPGETVSYFNPEDCGWYRARCLNSSTLALLDGGKLVSVTGADKCRKLPAKYEAVPEFCAVLVSNTVQLGASLNCKILAQTSNGYKISMSDVETNADLGEGEVFRWLPTVEYQAVGIPEVARPPLVDGSKVLLVLADTLDKVYVRPADDESQRKYNDVLQQVLLSAFKAKPLTEPPSPGQTVIGKFIDECFYRALVRRINVKQNKYQIEYAEYGNIEVLKLENLYPCPADFDLSTVKTQVSMLKLAPPTEMSYAAKDFVQDLAQEEELLLTLRDGLKSAPSGSEANLSIVKNRIDVGARLVEMCTPDWKKMEQRGGDVIETEPIMFQDVVYTALPKTGCTVEVLDISVLKGGAICGYDRSDTNASTVFNQLTAKIADYCNSELGRHPYLPKPEELCVAQLPPYPQWFRAVFLDLVSGAGSSEAKICYLDYGNISNVPVTLLRKMMPEFITGLPVMGLYLEIRDFPQEASDEMLARAVLHMNIDDEGRGTLKVSNCEKQADGIYLVDAPELLAAMKG